MTKKKQSIRSNIEFSNWDQALEDMLQRSIVPSLDIGHVPWKSTTKHNSSSNHIDKPKAIYPNTNSNLLDGYSKKRESMIRNMILSPLSPRKPTVISKFSHTNAKSDHKKLEKVFKTHIDNPNKESFPNKKSNSQQLARAFSIPTKFPMLGKDFVITK